MKDNRNYQNKEWLKREYLEKGRMISDIAKECGVDISTVGKYVKKFGIGRSRSKRKHSKYRDKKWLYEQYIILNKNVPQIAQECNCYPLTITRWVIKHKIKKYGDRATLIKQANDIIYKRDGLL